MRGSVARWVSIRHPSPDAPADTGSASSAPGRGPPSAGATLSRLRAAGRSRAAEHDWRRLRNGAASPKLPPCGSSCWWLPCAGSPAAARRRPSGARAPRHLPVLPCTSRPLPREPPGARRFPRAAPMRRCQSGPPLPLEKPASRLRGARRRARPPGPRRLRPPPPRPRHRAPLRAPRAPRPRATPGGDLAGLRSVNPSAILACRRPARLRTGFGASRCGSRSTSGLGPASLRVCWC